MSDINPFEHPPVYKEDQVITKEDLTLLEEMYRISETKLYQANYQIEAWECCVVHSIMNTLKEWIDAGKPKEEFFKEEDNE